MNISFNPEFNSYSVIGSELCVTAVYNTDFVIIAFMVIDLSLSELFAGSLHECMLWAASNFQKYPLS